MTMLPKPVILSPTAAQIADLRANFFERLDRDGAPCKGKSETMLTTN